MRLKGFAIAFILVVAAAVVAFKKPAAPHSGSQHVFINETADHRFDESIQVSILASFARTQVQNAVVITDAISASDLETSAAELFKTLALGRENGGRAILYLFSPAQHALKIEVGYALEGALPDVTVKGLEGAAKTFIFNDHYQDFWAELINTLNIEIYEREQRGQAVEAFDFSKMKFVSGGAGIASRLYDATPERLAEEMKRIPPDRQSRYSASSDLRESLANYLRSLHDGIGESALPLLSDESRIFREFTPLTTYQLFRNWRMYTKAGVDRIVDDGEFAYVVFKRDYPVLPLVFERIGGVWKIQEPMSWSLFQRFEDSMRVFLKFDLALKSAEGRSYLARAFGKPLYESPSADPRNWPKDFTRFYFQYYWLDRVAKELEGLSAAKMSDDLLWIALDTMTNLGRMTPFLEIHREIARRHPENRNIARNLEFYEKMFVFEGPTWRLKR